MESAMLHERENKRLNFSRLFFVSTRCVSPNVPILKYLRNTCWGVVCLIQKYIPHTRCGHEGYNINENVE